MGKSLLLTDRTQLKKSIIMNLTNRLSLIIWSIHNIVGNTSRWNGGFSLNRVDFTNLSQSDDLIRPSDWQNLGKRAPFKLKPPFRLLLTINAIRPVQCTYLLVWLHNQIYNPPPPFPYHQMWFQQSNLDQLWCSKHNPGLENIWNVLVEFQSGEISST